MRLLSLLVIAFMVASCMTKSSVEMGRDSETLEELDTNMLTKSEREQFESTKKRLETDPAFRREVEAQLDEKMRDLPASERQETKKRFFGLFGLRFPFFGFPFFGKRDVEEIKVQEIEKPEMKRDDMKEIEKPEMKRDDMKEIEKPEMKRDDMKEIEKLEIKRDDMKEIEKPEMKRDDMKEIEKPETKREKTELESTRAAAKRFFGLWGLGLGYGYGLGLGFGFPFYGKKRSMESVKMIDDMPAVDREMLEKRDREFERFVQAEKKYAPELYKRENETVTMEEVKEMKKRWWGLGYGYGLGLGYGWGLGYPWGFWGKRDTMPTEKRDEFVTNEMMKKNREIAYERLMKDL